MSVPTNFSRSLVSLLFGVIALAASTVTLTPQKANALDSEEQIFLTQINSYRAQNGLGTLTLNDKLDDVARWMANDLATNNYFSHVDSLGRDPFQRTEGLGYNAWRGENLAAGTQGSAATFQLWHDSAPHNDNMLDPHYTTIGIARAYSTSSAFGWYWVTEFAGEDAPPPARAPAVAPEPAPSLDPVAVPVLEAQRDSPPAATAFIPDPTSAPKAIRRSYPAHSGILIEGMPPIHFGPRARGTFLSALLELATAVHRSSSRHGVRVVR